MITIVSCIIIPQHLEMENKRLIAEDMALVKEREFLVVTIYSLNFFTNAQQGQGIIRHSNLKNVLPTANVEGTGTVATKMDLMIATYARESYNA